MANKKNSGGIKDGHRQLHVNVKTAKKRKPSSTKWLQRQLNDPYVHMAKKEGYRSRAAYKLIEIDEKFKILKSGKNIIDLGAAPGGWTQVCVAAVKTGTVVGIDLLEMEPIAGATLIKYDFTADDAPQILEDAMDGKKADIVLSDMAASACGHAPTDHIRIMHLCELAFDFAKQNLAAEGSFVAKILRGGAEKELLDELRKCFKVVKHFKPESSRKDSSEMYVIGTGFKI